MANYGFNNLRIDFDDSGGTLQNMSNYITEVNGVKVSGIYQESHAAGDSWVEELFTGLKKMDPVTVKGFYDDAATTGPDAIFNAPGTTVTRTLKFTWGGTKTTTVETHIQDYVRHAVRNQLTAFEATVLPTGAVVEV